MVSSKKPCCHKIKINKLLSKMSRKGKVLSAQTRAIVFNVLQFALREKKAKEPLLDLYKAMDRVAAMTGLCRDTLSKIKKEGSINGGVWETKVKKKRQKVITNPNDVDKINIINKIEEFQKRNETVSLRKLLKELKHENNFSGGKTSLQIVLKSMGYKWDKNENNKKVFQKAESVTNCPVDLKPKHKEVLNPAHIPEPITPTTSCSIPDSMPHQNISIHRVPLPPEKHRAPSAHQVPGAGQSAQRPLLLHSVHTTPYIIY